MNLQYTPEYWYSYAAEKYWSAHEYKDYECPDCGRGVDRVYRFVVHHRDGKPRNHDWDNLVGLCQRCSIWRHRNPTMSGLDVGEWKEEFQTEVLG